MKRVLALLAGTAFLAAASPAMAASTRDYDRGSDRGYSQSFRGNDFGMRARVDQTARDLNVAYRQGVIDHGALSRAMKSINSYRVMMRDGTSRFEAQRIQAGLNSIERTIAERRNHRDHGRRW